MELRIPCVHADAHLQNFTGGAAHKAPCASIHLTVFGTGAGGAHGMGTLATSIDHWRVAVSNVQNKNKTFQEIIRRRVPQHRVSRRRKLVSISPMPHAFVWGEW